MTSTNSTPISSFSFSEEGSTISDRTLRNEGVMVRELDWEIAADESYSGTLHADFAKATLAEAGVSVDTHVVVGSHFEDLSGWCDAEQKYEYFSKTTYLVLPREVVDPELPSKVWCDKAAELGFHDWASVS